MGSAVSSSDVVGSLVGVGVSICKDFDGTMVGTYGMVSGGCVGKRTGLSLDPRDGCRVGEWKATVGSNDGLTKGLRVGCENSITGLGVGLMVG